MVSEKPGSRKPDIKTIRNRIIAPTTPLMVFNPSSVELFMSLLTFFRELKKIILTPAKTNGENEIQSSKASLNL